MFKDRAGILMFGGGGGVRIPIIAVEGQVKNCNDYKNSDRVSLFQLMRSKFQCALK